MTNTPDRPIWSRLLDKIDLPDKDQIPALMLAHIQHWPDHFVNHHWFWIGANANPKNAPASRLHRDSNNLPYRRTVHQKQRGVIWFPPYQKLLSAHEAIWTMLRGPVPPAKRLKQQCDPALCVNPTHWKLVDGKEHKVHRAKPMYKPDPNSDMIELMDLIEGKCAAKRYSGLDELASHITSFTKSEILEAVNAIGGAVALQILGTRAS